MVKPLKLAGIFGIIILVLTGISVIISLSTIFGSNDFESKSLFKILTLMTLIILPFFIVFLYGFVALGKRFDNKLLYFSTWITIIFLILGAILTIGLYATGNLYPDVEDDQSGSSLKNIFKQGAVDTPIVGPMLNIFGGSLFWPLIIIIGIGGLTLRICFIIGIFKLRKNQVQYAGWAGGFEIASLILDFEFVTILTETILFFAASKKFESGNTKIIAK